MEEVLEVLWRYLKNYGLMKYVKTTYQYIFDLKEKLEKTCEMTQENLRKSSARYKKAYNRKARDRKLNIGDKVLILLQPAIINY